MPPVRNEPVVLVHGWGGSFATTWQGPGWEALLADAGRTVIGVDLLGHGSAPKPHDPEAYADLTTRVLEAMPSDGPVDAIGFSLGARTLLELAARAPERFSRLVVAGVGKNLFVDDPERRQAILDAVDGKETDNNIGRLFAQYANQAGNDPIALGRLHEADRHAPHRRAARRGHDAGARGPRRQGLRRARRPARGRSARRPPASRSRVSTTSPRPSPSPSSTPPSNSSTRSRRDRRRRRRAAARRPGGVPDRDGLRARGRRHEHRRGGADLRGEGPPARPPRHRAPRRRLPARRLGRGGPRHRARPGGGVLARAADAARAAQSGRSRRRHRRPGHGGPAGARPPPGPRTARLRSAGASRHRRPTGSAR